MTDLRPDQEQKKKGYVMWHDGSKKSFYYSGKSNFFSVQGIFITKVMAVTNIW